MAAALARTLANHSDDAICEALALLIKQQRPALQDALLNTLQAEDGEMDERKKRMKALNKKIQQIDALKKKGGDLDEDAAAKVASESELRHELQCLEQEKEYVPADKRTAWPPEKNDKSKVFPTEEAERTKLIRNLKKKAQQIEALKAKGEALDPEARAKVASESRLLQEIAALERGDSEVVYEDAPPPSVAEQLTDAKTDIERKVKAVQKKLDSIAALKESGRALTAEEKTKVDSEAALKKERHQLQQEVGKINQEERDRVEERLGWTDSQATSKNKKKQQNK
jgi:hypothetical protein